MDKLKITVFTPTYNRASTLPRCYQSLCRQSYKNFVWLIVDDGSTDNTHALVSDWIAENKIEIKYIYQENGGKYRAVNTGVLNCDTAVFSFLDSDDYYLDDTLEKFIEYYHEIKNNPKVAGIMGRRGYDAQTIIGNPNLPSDKFIANYDTIVRKYRFSGDTCRMYKTEILRNYLYPETNDKFIPENVMLGRIDQSYDLYIINKIMSISNYREDGYTMSGRKLYLKNKHGYFLGLNQKLVARRGLKDMFFSTILYTLWWWCFGKEIGRVKCLNPLRVALFMPFSIICYIFRKPSWIFEE